MICAAQTSSVEGVEVDLAQPAGSEGACAGDRSPDAADEGTGEYSCSSKD